jgi:hypothetical protein
MKIVFGFALAASLCLTGCGTVSKCPCGNRSRHNFVRLNSDPAGAAVTIFNAIDGRQVFTGTTPTYAHLEDYQSPLLTQTFRVVFDKPGFHPLETWLASTPSGWYEGDFSERAPWMYSLVEPPIDASWGRLRKELHRQLISQDVRLGRRDLKALEKVENQP